MDYRTAKPYCSEIKCRRRSSIAEKVGRCSGSPKHSFIKFAIFPGLNLQMPKLSKMVISKHTYVVEVEADTLLPQLYCTLSRASNRHTELNMAG